MNPPIVIACMLLASSLRPAMSSAQPQEGPPKRSGNPALKPGFAFDPTDAVPYPGLQGYDIEHDVLSVELIASAGLVRQLVLLNTANQARLRIRIAVSPTGAADLGPYFAAFAALSQAPAEERLVDGASVGLTIGDDSQVGTGSSSSQVQDEIAFRRANVFVSIEHTTAGTLNLLSIASEIDAAIQALPDVTPAQLAALRPQITQFTPASAQLQPSQVTELTVAAIDPAGTPLSRTYRSSDGYGTVGTPDRYQAGSILGRQNLTLIVSNPALLFDQAEIGFTVASP